MNVYVLVEDDFEVRGVYSTYEAAEIAANSMFRDMVSGQPELGKYGWNTFLSIQTEELE